MSDEKLKPCPFCGGEAEIKETENDVGCKIWYIECSDCELTIKNGYLPKGLIRKWNTRKPMERIVEQLTEERDKPEYDEFETGCFNKAISIVKRGGTN